MNCSIRVNGHLDVSWQDWFAGMRITHEPQGTTLFSGPLPDQAALYGVLLKIRSLNLSLLEVRTEEKGEPGPST